MSIARTDIIWRYPAEISDASSNGGRMTANIVPKSTTGAIFPNANEAERTAGSTKYRKLFIHNANDDDLALLNPRFCIETPTPGADAVVFFPGTQTDTQASITGSENVYGAGYLFAQASPAVNSIQVTTEGASFNMFRSGMLIRISDKTDPLSDGFEQFCTISGTPTYNGNVATIALTTTIVSHTYPANTTKVSSVYQPSTIQTSGSSVVVSSTLGTYNSGTYPIIMDNMGSIEQTWTLTFTSANAFNLVGNSLGAIGTGTTSADIVPNNTDYTKPYFTMSSAGFGGTFATSDTIVFTTHPSSVSIWCKRVIPTNTGSISGNKFTLYIDGESN